MNPSKKTESPLLELAEIVAPGRRRHGLGRMGNDKMSDDGGRLEKRSAVGKAKCRNEPQGAQVAVLRCPHLFGSHPDIGVRDFQFLKQKMRRDRSPGLDVVELVHSVLPLVAPAPPAVFPNSATHASMIFMQDDAATAGFCRGAWRMPTNAAILKGA